jgi:hypothetical protein
MRGKAVRLKADTTEDISGRDFVAVHRGKNASVGHGLQAVPEGRSEDRPLQCFLYTAFKTMPEGRLMTGPHNVSCTRPSRPCRRAV